MTDADTRTIHTKTAVNNWSEFYQLSNAVSFANQTKNPFVRYKNTTVSINAAIEALNAWITLVGVKPVTPEQRKAIKKFLDWLTHDRLEKKRFKTTNVEEPLPTSGVPLTEPPPDDSSDSSPGSSRKSLEELMAAQRAQGDRLVKLRQEITTHLQAAIIANAKASNLSPDQFRLLLQADQAYIGELVLHQIISNPKHNLSTIVDATLQSFQSANHNLAFIHDQIADPTTVVDATANIVKQQSDAQVQQTIKQVESGAVSQAIKNNALSQEALTDLVATQLRKNGVSAQRASLIASEAVSVLGSYNFTNQPLASPENVADIIRSAITIAHEISGTQTKLSPSETSIAKDEVIQQTVTTFLHHQRAELSQAQASQDHHLYQQSFTQPHGSQINPDALRTGHTVLRLFLDTNPNANVVDVASAIQHHFQPLTPAQRQAAINAYKTEVDTFVAKLNTADKHSPNTPLPASGGNPLQPPPAITSVATRTLRDTDSSQKPQLLDRLRKVGVNLDSGGSPTLHPNVVKGYAAQPASVTHQPGQPQLRRQSISPRQFRIIEYFYPPSAEGGVNFMTTSRSGIRSFASNLGKDLLSRGSQFARSALGGVGKLGGKLLSAGAGAISTGGAALGTAAAAFAPYAIVVVVVVLIILIAVQLLGPRKSTRTSQVNSIGTTTTVSQPPPANIAQACWPIHGVVIDGPLDHPKDRLSGKTNSAIDIRVSNGTPIPIPFDGCTVSFLESKDSNGTYKGNGLYAYARCTEGTFYFSHLNDFAGHTLNQRVPNLPIGTIIGHSDETGNTSGPHLHLELVSPSKTPGLFNVFPDISQSATPNTITADNDCPDDYPNSSPDQQI